MSGSEEPNLFLRKETDSEDDEEWDDTELIAAYDRAITVAKRKIVRKIQKELGLKDEDVEEYFSDTEPPGSKMDEKKGIKKKSGRGKWVVGSSCRTVYSEDGEEYEAVIVKIINNHWCIVRFVGYENEEEVLFEALTPSCGKTAVQMQIEASNNQNMSGEEKIQDEVPKPQVRHAIPTEDIPRPEACKTFFEPKIQRLPMSFPIPPPPPAPPAMMMKDQFRQQDDISSMLMSWYMCGYYTGLYQRGQQTEKN